MVKKIKIPYFWNGIYNWFNREKKNPFDQVMVNLELLKREIPRFLSANSGSFSLSPLMRERYIRPIKDPLVKKLDNISNPLVSFENRLTSVNTTKIKTLITLRIPSEAVQFYSRSKAIISFWNRIKKLIFKDTISNKEKKELIDKVKNLIDILPTLKALSETISESLTPREFDLSNAHITFNAPGRTYDGIRINRILRLAKGLGFDVNIGRRHDFTINLNDGIPCAIGPTTGWINHVIDRFARASRRSSSEVEELLARI